MTTLRTDVRTAEQYLDLEEAIAAAKERDGYWYLASPYSKYPGGIIAAWELVCREAARLILARVPVYSPIAHTHPIAVHGGVDPYDHSIWLSADRPLMDAARGLIVLRAESWEQSYGVGVEINEFCGAGKQIVYMDPGFVPRELLA